ncbi:HlyD family secretion protein, partial [Neomesorhizobium albiziae]
RNRGPLSYQTPGLLSSSSPFDAYRSKLSRCVIKAPFDGRIALMRAHAHEIPDRTQPLMQVVGEAELEIEMLLPSQWLRWLKAGVVFDFSIEETGKSLPAEVTRIAAVVDPVSQTVKVTGRFTGTREGVLPGMSGPAKFAAPDG